MRAFFLVDFPMFSESTHLPWTVFNSHPHVMRNTHFNQINPPFFLVKDQPTKILPPKKESTLNTCYTYVSNFWPRFIPRRFVFDTKEEGAVRPFEDSVGRGMFVSHQWLSPENPDPNFEQLEVLQKTMKNLLRGAKTEKGDYFFSLFFVVLGEMEVLFLKHANCNVYLLVKNLKCFFWFKISVSRTWWLWRLRCQSGKPFHPVTS